MGDQTDKAATRKTNIIKNKHSESIALEMYVQCHLRKLRPICTIHSHLERDMLFEA